jgi:hypothetical protein
VESAPRGGVAGGWTGRRAMEFLVASQWYLALVMGIQQCGGDWVWVGWNGIECGVAAEGQNRRNRWLMEEFDYLLLSW